MRIASFILVVTLALTGCRDFAVDENGDGAVPGGSDQLVALLSEPFELSFGQSVELDDTGLQVEFSQLVEDNRCASDVDCIQAGRAGVVLSVVDGQTRYQLVAFIPGLVATPYRFNEIIQFQDFRFQLLRVNPYPESGKLIPDQEYKVLLEVEPVGL